MNSNQIRNTILHLSLIDGIGPTAIARITTFLGLENMDRVYTLTHSDFLHGVGLSAKQTEKIMQRLADSSLVDQEIKLIAKHSISWALSHEDEYPALLKTIHIPPPVLFWQGALPGSNSLAVVGSRDANSYGSMAIDMIVPQLVNNQWAIVSGGARGADTMSHKKTLEHGGVTVAVLGSGLLRPYPAENKRLFQEIVEKGGALVSSFPALMSPLAENFPARNRVIAGLSRGCIVIQAAAKSGARITADFCLSQGREVFAIPGPINDPLSAGCHELIGQGAKLTTNAGQILSEFGYEVSELVPVVNSKKDQKNLFTPASYAQPVDPAEAALLNACAQPCSADELLEATGIPLIELSKRLFDLQIQGKLTQNMAGLWQRR